MSHTDATAMWQNTRHILCAHELLSTKGKHRSDTFLLVCQIRSDILKPSELMLDIPVKMKAALSEPPHEKSNNLHWRQQRRRSLQSCMKKQKKKKKKKQKKKKKTMRLLNRSDTNRGVQQQKTIEALNFSFKKKRDCTLRVAKTKALIRRLF